MSFFEANWNVNKLGNKFENIRFYTVANKWKEFNILLWILLIKFPPKKKIFSI